MTKMRVRDQSELLRANRIFNEYELSAATATPYVRFFINTWLGGAWSVHLVNKHKGSLDYDLSFNGLQRKRDKDKAIAWATERFGIMDWVQSPFGPGAWVSRSAVDVLIARLVAGKSA